MITNLQLYDHHEDIGHTRKIRAKIRDLAKELSIVLGRGREGKYLVEGGGGRGGVAERAGTESTYLGTC